MRSPAAARRRVKARPDRRQLSPYVGVGADKSGSRWMALLLHAAGAYSARPATSRTRNIGGAQGFLSGIGTSTKLPSPNMGERAACDEFAPTFARKAATARC